MNRTRTYGDSCGIARALDIVGERWALLVARELLHGPKRFTDLRAGLPRLGPDMLSQRLRELEHAGVVRRRTLPPPAASRVYELTEWGSELAPVLLALGRWGSRAPMAADAPALGVDAAIVALETTFDAEASAGADESYELRLGEEAFTLAIAADGLVVARGPAEAPVARIATDTTTLAAVMWHGRPLSEALGDTSMTIDGDPADVERLVARFSPPTPAAV
jgi:DNA-binding HxlR family transcriptional regulator